MEIEKKLQTENIKCGSGLNQVRIFAYGLTDNIFNIIADMTFGIFIQLIRINRPAANSIFATAKLLFRF